MASGRREREGMAWMQASGAKATALDCMGGDGEGNCASIFKAQIPIVSSGGGCCTVSAFPTINRLALPGHAAFC